ncbi:universal stress protein [Ornithinimicrobium pratense]|uniref:Universal stress protein n=1 Tax=Ornithinimicrobium pratense TaxID=2593973 RepID=A0A5J6V6I5_9MICO|nr:universal stress protein [Ornithinimicrobium pratense]QFG69395.1 universal stress protein [Ornithinimicrobium pratense]
MTATMTAPGPVLVGVDGSAHNASAVAWAAAEASASAGIAPLVLVHDTQTTGQAPGRAILDRASADAARIDSRLRPGADLVSGGPAHTLLVSAHTWERALGREGGTALVVIGRRGEGGHQRINLGRTARTLIHQDGPTLVVVPDDWAPGQVPADAPVVIDLGAVGHDNGQSGSVLAFALARALRSGRPALAVASWSVPVSAASQERSIPAVWTEHAELAEQALEQLLAPWRRLYPGVLLTGLATDRSPVLALLAHGEGAELLVMRRGPRASAVVEYADGPVAVV